MGCSASKSKEVKPSGGPGASSATASNAIGACANGTYAQKPATEAAAADTAQPSQNGTTLSANKSPSNHSVEAPTGRAADASRDNKNTNGDSTEAPDKGPRQNGAGLSSGDLDENGNAVLLPKGVWVKTEGTPYYYCAEENLYFHPPSCQFYDPTNEMWYDPEKDEWYRDDGSDAEAA
ncbi:conserved hypothetical protein [Leishmania major strain Friedlin]|uniref:OCRE domain-containing protein n=1 Tax=Leishmania major TaxID=5664 RepID=Q4Q487_LEIMA|nr:conserved hypothetical protein [Leishmania major strain Friedlin]CAG9580677.1 hypothetical_protein_-_conserved [Leishmania major strain Friedlin]CAJ06191.1 conserved hypothetical protein [Leishmania major strain Friedlin]|eukprot:XP_001685861.1 conserved hypothetical protein [Leishmania major strain Friedlin]